MSPSTALRPRAGEAAPWRSLLGHDLVAIVLAGLAALIVATWLVDSPGRVPLTVVNHTDYELTIATSKPGSNSWLPLLVIDPGEERTVQGAIDPGPEWVFRFAGQGRDGGEIAVTRDELRDAGWRFEVPPEVITQLEEAGATPPHR
jgi:hypothetical protein